MRSHDLVSKQHTAESAISTAIPILTNSNASVSDARNLINEKADSFDSINYVYITDHAHKLINVVSIKALFKKSPDTPLSHLSPESIVTIRPHTTLERAAYLAVSHSIKAIPVVDKDEKLQGIISSDTILETIYRESEQDIFRMSGVTHPPRGKYEIDHLMKIPVLTAIKHRIPWLIIGLIGGFFMSFFIEMYEEILTSHIIIAAFIPLIVYMSAAIGIQMEAFIIRDLAISPSFRFGEYAKKQFLIVTIMGFIISTLFFSGILLFYQETVLALIISIALFITILSSMITGLFIPYAFKLIELDPANASGPIGTIVQDIVSIIIYLVIVSTLFSL